jgi:hypothetical protein
MNIEMANFFVKIFFSVIGGAAIVYFLTLKNEFFYFVKKIFGVGLENKEYIKMLKILLALVLSTVTLIFFWQSVLTSGVATLSAILFILSQWISRWRKIIYQSFFVVYKVIWVGIALNSLYIIFFALFGIKSLWEKVYPINLGSPQWFFSEAIFAIIVLNGVYIGKAIGPGIANALKKDEAPSGELFIKISLSGSISFVSWYSWLIYRSDLNVYSKFNFVDSILIWLAAVLLVFSLTILLEEFRKTLYARSNIRT